MGGRQAPNRPPSRPRRTPPLGDCEDFQTPGANPRVKSNSKGGIAGALAHRGDGQPAMALAIRNVVSTVESNHFCVLKSRGAILDIYETGQYQVPLSAHLTSAFFPHACAGQGA